MLNLDFSFLTAQVLSDFVLKGLLFSVQLTLVAMVGGIALGTLIALMRLSGKPWLEKPAAFYVNTLRSMSQGLATYEAEYDHLAELNGTLADKVVQGRVDEHA